MTGTRSSAAFYADSLDAFLRASDDVVYAPLTSPHGYTLAPEQLSAWRLQLPILRAALAEVAQQKGDSHHFRHADGSGDAKRENGDCHLFAPWLHLEFDIPRLGRRVDAVLVTSTAVLPIEFKVGAKKFHQLDYEQAWDYGLDLRNFHAPSHAAPIFPILCATDAPASDRRWKPPHADGVHPPFCCNTAGLGPAIALALDEVTVSAPISAAEMVADTVTATSPGPTRGPRTSRSRVPRSSGSSPFARTRGRKAIVFVMGVPGAGKTLVGLNVATRHGSSGDAAHAVFLSGNGPLVAVLTALIASRISR